MFSMNRQRGSGLQSVNIWPGFVDALSALLMVIIFVLMIFMVAQFYLSNLLSGQEETVSQLASQVEELDTLLEIERDENREMRGQITEMSADLQAAVEDREALRSSLTSLRSERESAERQLADAVRLNRELTAETEQLDRRLADAVETIDADQETIELQLQEIASLQADLQALRSVRDDLEIQVASLELVRRSLEDEVAEGVATVEERDMTIAAMAADLIEAETDIETLRSETVAAEDEIDVARRALSAAQAEVDTLEQSLRLTEENRERLMAELAAVRDRTQDLSESLSTEQERTVLAQRQLDERDIRIEELSARLSATQGLLEEQLDLRREAEGRVAVLDQEVLDLRNQLDRVEALLAVSEEQVDAQDLEIAQLEGRLNQALLREVEELTQYRSEFFGRLRQVLGGREDVRIVGDRFIFQSEVLFPTGSATLQQGGQSQLAELADELMSVAEQFPPDVDWILRVDGHTDTVPISTPEFPSNWELSAARALEVVKFLADQGIPEDRLAAAGFGEHQPIADGTSPEALARNRRIELQLDRGTSSSESEIVDAYDPDLPTEDVSETPDPASAVQ